MNRPSGAGGSTSGGVGVDRLSVSFPLRSFEPDQTAWNRSGVNFPGQDGEQLHRAGTAALGGVDVFVGVIEVTRGQLWGKVECNPARIRDPDGYSLLPLDEAASAARAMIAAAADLVEPGGPIDAARIKRVDVARDFVIGTAPSFYVRALLGLKRPYARRSYIYSDPGRNRAETLWAGSKAGGCRLYDQHEAYGDKGAPVGALRWEVEARADWLGRIAGIRSVGQLEAARLEAVAVNRWKWSRMGTEVMATDAVVERVLGAGLTPAVERGVLGHMLLQSHGVARPLAKGTAAKYDRVIRELGITLDSGAERATAPGFAGRLDWDSGREVVRAA